MSEPRRYHDGRRVLVLQPTETGAELHSAHSEIALTFHALEWLVEHAGAMLRERRDGPPPPPPPTPSIGLPETRSP